MVILTAGTKDAPLLKLNLAMRANNFGVTPLALEWNCPPHKEGYFIHHAS